VALSTAIIQVIGNIHLFHRLFRLGIIKKIRLRDLRPVRHYYQELAKQGFPTTLNMMTVTIGIFIITWFAGRYGKEVVAAYGIGTRIEQLALLPVMGLNVSTLALSAQNFGAQRLDRVRRTLLISLRYGFILASFGTMAGLLFAGELMALFTPDRDVITAGANFLKIEAFVLPAYVVLYICVSVMQGIKRPLFALIIGLYRQIAARCSCFTCWPMSWPGGNGHLVGILITTWSAALIVVAYVTWVLEKLEQDHGDTADVV
jgi:Na+-driven multidrug efflux pump